MVCSLAGQIIENQLLFRTLSLKVIIRMQAQAGPGTYKHLINTRSFTHTLYVPLTLLTIL